MLSASIALLGAFAANLQAQTLQQRKPSPAGARVDGAQSAPEPSDRPLRGALPLAAEGEYLWGEAGEVIELYLEGAELRGYLTRRSERRDAGSAPMTFRFARATAAGDRISFTTRQIHGDWYSFSGRLARGPARTPRENGYYLLTGALQLHAQTAGAESDATASSGAGTVTRHVSLELAGSRPSAAPARVPAP